MKSLNYKGYVLAINELPSFDNSHKLYRGTTELKEGRRVRDASTVEQLVDWFRTLIDYLKEKEKYEQILKDWGNSYKSVKYKNKYLSIQVQQRFKLGKIKVVYLGTFSYYKDPSRQFYSKEKSIESIHYDKVISKFKRFVDEYCTDWRDSNNWIPKITYKGYCLTIKEEYQVANYFGACEIHKNSTFKCISNSLNEIDKKFKARIDKVIEGKEKAKMNKPDVSKFILTEKEQRFGELEAQIAKLQKDIEKIKNEKETYTYKGVVLEYGREEELPNTYVVGKIKGTSIIFQESHNKAVIEKFEDYIDELEKKANLYCQLTSKKILDIYQQAFTGNIWE